MSASATSEEVVINGVEVDWLASLSPVVVMRRSVEVVRTRSNRILY